MHEIKLPKTAKDMETGTILRWLKSAGDAISKGDVLAEIETERDRIELESPCDGQLKQIMAEAGTTAAVGAVIATVDATGEAAECAKNDAPAENTPGGKVTPIVMPQAGNSMEEGTLVTWQVKVGDNIKVGDVVFEAETDKATIEVEADHAGRLARIVAQEGDIVAVLEPVAYLADSDADVDAYLANSVSQQPAETQAPAAQPKKAETPTATPTAQRPLDGTIKASPAARKAAGQKGLDLKTIFPGTGPGGRIVLDDVRNTQATPAAAGQSTRKPMSPMRKAIAKNLLLSKQSIPHFYMRLTINAEPMYKFYKDQKAQYPCSVNDLVVLACAKAIAQMPAIGAKIDSHELVEPDSINIGLAVGVENGLVVPVIVGADRMSLKQLAARTKELAQSARSGKIEAMGQGIFTITNLGMFGVEEFSAIINPPEAAILAVGAIREAVIVRDGEMQPGRVMTMTISADHRIIDGVLAAEFLAKLKELLESPNLMQLEIGNTTLRSTSLRSTS